MLWATGVGAEVIRPMAAPVLGGILVADEVIDLLLPVVFYRVRLARLRRLGRTGESDVTTAMRRLERREGSASAERSVTANRFAKTRRQRSDDGSSSSVREGKPRLG